MTPRAGWRTVDEELRRAARAIKDAREAAETAREVRRRAQATMERSRSTRERLASRPESSTATALRTGLGAPRLPARPALPSPGRILPIDV